MNENRINRSLYLFCSCY